MKTVPKYLSAAIAAALATSVVPTQVSAVNLSQDNIGDVGIAEYYTVRDGWQTELTLVNTSDSTVAAKFRFHEGRNSREVLDFIVVLSPYDMVQAIAREDANGNPVLQFPANSETSCVVPVPAARRAGATSGGTLAFSDRAYSGANFDNYRGDNSLDRAKEGYFVVIQMGAAPPGAENNASQIVPYNSLHVNEVPRNCLAVENAFRNENIVSTYRQFERNLNALKLSYSLTNVARGTQGSNSATMLANFATKESFIAHTKTSIQSQAAALAPLQAAVATAQANLAAAETRVNNAVADLQEASDGDGIGDIAGCTYTPDASVPPEERVLNYTGCPTALTAELSAALAARTTASNQLQAANDALAAAAARLLVAPRNLIHSQDVLGDQYPQLNQGDFFATWLYDGNYKHPLTNDDPNEAVSPGIIPTPFNRYWFGIYARPVDGVTALLMKSSAINEWADNPVTGASSDLVLTAPTKAWYTDWRYTYNPNRGGSPHLTGISPVLGLALANTTFGWPPFSEQFSQLGQACDRVGLDVYNRDETPLADPVLPSPRATVDLCWETNVLYTGVDSALSSKQAVAVPVDAIATTSPAGTFNGWLQVKMDQFVTQYHPAIPLLNITIPYFRDILDQPDGFGRVVQVGMPYIGFAYKERNMGQAASYAGITPHSYLRNWDDRNFIGGELRLTDPTLLNALSGPIFPDTFPESGNPLNEIWPQVSPF